MVRQTLTTEEYFIDMIPASHSTLAAKHWHFLEAVRANENFEESR